MTRHLIEATSLGDLLLRAADRWPDRDALVFPEQRRSFAEMARGAWAVARALVGFGIASGEHVGILMPNGPAFLDLLFGCALAGAVPVPLNGRYRAREMAYVVENADLAILFTTDEVAEHADFAAVLAEAFPDLAEQPDPGRLRLVGAPLLRRIVLRGAARPGFTGWDTVEAAGAAGAEAEVGRRRAAVKLGDPCLMMYTSGTTADPKGCLLCHESVVRNAFSMNREKYRFAPDDRVWDPLPLFHMAALLPMLTAWSGGAAFLSMGHVEAGAALAMIEGEKATALFPLFPTVMTGLIGHPDFARRDLGHVRRVTNTGPAEMLRRFQAAMPWALHSSAYGMTENGGGMCMASPDDPEEARMTTCGTPLSGMRVRVVDPETGAELPAGQQGELQVNGYSVFAGYYRDPLRTAEVLRGGWFRTGDLCSVDEAGRVACHGRIKDMLKVGGENVAALEIESFLQTHPAVKLAQVVGVPDERLSEVPAAFVELAPGAEATPAELIGFCEGRIARFKVPRHVRFVTEWPMSATKIHKVVLRSAFLADVRWPEPAA
ncbi:MAG: AMP-binding protein [Alphaproteobacteria bacterium]|nr:AMP-binding protein [Alphaproteobacteria bacterium]